MEIRTRLRRILHLPVVQISICEIEPGDIGMSSKIKRRARRKIMENEL
jgi:hypothetical protein